MRLGTPPRVAELIRRIRRRADVRQRRSRRQSHRDRQTPGVRQGQRGRAVHRRDRAQAANRPSGRTVSGRGHPPDDRRRRRGRGAVVLPHIRLHRGLRPGGLRTGTAGRTGHQRPAPCDGGGLAGRTDRGSFGQRGAPPGATTGKIGLLAVDPSTGGTNSPCASASHMSHGCWSWASSASTPRR